MSNPVSSLYGRLFARFYDRMLAATEEAGLEQQRADLLAEASGRVLELGAGTGLNLGHYRDSVTELVLAEPEAPMVRQLRKRTRNSSTSTHVVEAPGEELPFGDDEFDTVVSTLVLCTVDDPARALAEATRVLKPGGRLLFLEHVRSEEPKIARWQDRLERPWGFVGHGCHPNRDTEATIAASAFEIERLDHGRVPKAPPIVRPLISGSAMLPV